MMTEFTVLDISIGIESVRSRRLFLRGPRDHGHLRNFAQRIQRFSSEAIRL